MPPDGLFEPSIVARPQVTQPVFDRNSMYIPAFFGGPLTLLFFAWTSASRLHESPGRRRLIAVVCAVAVIGSAVVAAVMDANGDEPRLRFFLAASGMVAQLATATILKPGQRRFELSGGEYEKIGFGRGLVACIVLGLVHFVVMYIAMVAT